MILISLQKHFLLLRYSNFRILETKFGNEILPVYAILQKENIYQKILQKSY